MKPAVSASVPARLPARARQRGENDSLPLNRFGTAMELQDGIVFDLHSNQIHCGTPR